jgi:excisionase family DNA binding protein
VADDELITIGEAARRLGLSDDSARRRADEGEFGEVVWTKPPRGGQRRVSAAAVEIYRRRMREG